MIEQACEIVYERLTGKCWHDYSGWFQVICKKCGKPFMGDRDNVFPNLATSLDAWRPIWEGMNATQWDTYDKWIKRIIARKGIWISFTYDPIDHLEAALRMLGEDELAQKVRSECK